MSLPIYQELKDKVAVVTGGGGILCSVMAGALAEQGVKVAILDLKEEAACQVAGEITGNGGTAIGLAANVLDREQLLQAREYIKEQLGPCDILINGAGGNHPAGTTSRSWHTEVPAPEERSFFDLDPEGIQHVFNLNFTGTLLPTQVFAADMTGREGCQIINVSSMNSFRPLTRIPAYSAAKAAVSNFTQWLAVHFSKTGIRVNALAPGFFLTDQNRELLTEQEGGYTDRGRTILSHTPLGRFGEPDDLTGTLVWLCSDSSRFVTGIVVPVDGGFSAFSGV